MCPSQQHLSLYSWCLDWTTVSNAWVFYSRVDRYLKKPVHLPWHLAVRILWTFDNDLLEFYGNFPGTPINNPSYRFPGINGYGSCLYLNRTLNQSVTIATPPFLNMAFTSFSLSAWVNADSFQTGWWGCLDNAIFGQFDQNTPSRSLHIIVRNQRIYLGFYLDDT